jgi:hypothetical protein
VVPHRVGHIQLRGGCDGEVDAIYGHDLNLFRIKFVWLSIRRQSITMPTEAHVKGTRRVCVIHTAVIQTL